jgi:hypothetical protein
VAQGKQEYIQEMTGQGSKKQAVECLYSIEEKPEQS